MQKWGSKRYCEINDLQKIEIFIDHSIIEIFLNDGEKAMTSRFFIEKKQPLLWISPLIKIASAEVSPIHFD